MTILIPLAITAGIGLAVALGASGEGDKPATDLADAWPAAKPAASASEARTYLADLWAASDEMVVAAGDDSVFAVEPAAGPEPLVEGVRVRSLDGAAADPAVDTSLLRYLAARGDKSAAEAEIARLRGLHPGWEPPPELFGNGRPVVDVTPLWQLYEQRDYAGVRQAIARIQAGNADWQPPANLLQLMEANETRTALEQAGGGARWTEIVDLARDRPEQFACERIDNMWRLAEAQARTGDRDAATATYARIVRDCDDADHRFATLQKAKDLLGQKAVAELLPLEAGRPRTAAQEARLKTLREQPKPVATATATRPAAPAQPRELTRLYARNATVEDADAAMDVARARKDNAAARKIGWLLHDAGREDEAVEWFSAALSWRAEPEAAKGLATAYAAKGDLAGLEGLQARWPGIVKPMLADARGAALGAAMERSDWQAVLVQTRGATAADRVLPRGWALTELRRPTEAMLSFQQVLHADEATPAQRDESAYGLVRSYLALNLYRDAEGAMQRYGVSPGKVFEVRGELLAKAATEAFEREDYRQVIVLLEQRRAIAEPSRGQLLQEAWARYHTDDLQAAGRIFAAQHRLLATRETAAGVRAVEDKLYPN